MALHQRSGKPVFITRGPRGSVIAADGRVEEVPGIQLLGRIDPVGAGDTATSALALCLGAGVPPLEAAKFANFAAAVTVRKLFQTGTASGNEIFEMSRTADYIYQPELAGDPRQAVYGQGSEIEICAPRDHFEQQPIRHAVFDHDGTISTLRQGWESVMAPVMIRAILGPRFDAADEALYHKVRNRVSDYIDKSTGIQTLLQMEALVDMVKEFGLVPEDQILDRFGYKQIYTEALMGLVSQRIEKFRRGELAIGDVTINGAVAWLQRLRQAGIKLYLASGTDREDVVAEAEALGYAELFDGGLYGAVGDVGKYNKRMVIEQILADNGLSGGELAVFGDGPVEIRECRRSGGIAVGVASDEVRRYGLNKEKRARLIRAGADAIIPDFSQPDALASVLLGARRFR
jgi:phosphoglycolate phosphatase-like HAD superfamily hydrolase